MAALFARIMENKIISEKVFQAGKNIRFILFKYLFY